MMRYYKDLPYNSQLNNALWARYAGIEITDEEIAYLREKAQEELQQFFAEFQDESI